MTLLEQAKKESEAGELQADWTDNGPFCTRTLCAQYDGRRCQAMGTKPHEHCEPAIVILVRHAAAAVAP